MAPRVRVETTRVAPGAAQTRWQVTWRITNAGAEPVALEDAWIPHGRFRGEGRVPLQIDLAAHASVDLQLTVAAHETPGVEVENAFLILRASETSQTWRIFTRLRVVFDAHGAPWPRVETVTLQSVPGSPGSDSVAGE